MIIGKLTSIQNVLENQVQVTLQLEPNVPELKILANNTNGIQEKLNAGLCQSFRIPDKTIRIKEIQIEKALADLLVQPPYGKNVIEGLNGTAVDAVEKVQAMRKCFQDLNINVQSIILGEFGLKIQDKLMDPRWNKTYVGPNSENENGDFWVQPIDRGGKPYYCPSGE